MNNEREKDPMPDEVSAPEPVQVPPSKPTREYSDIESQVEERFQQERPKLIAEVRREFQLKLDAKILQIQQDTKDENQKYLSSVVEQFKKDSTPPTQEEIRKLLDAEYLEFPVKIKWAGSKTPEIVVLTELSAEFERKFMRLVKEKAIPNVQLLTGLFLEMIQGTEEDKVKGFFNALETATDLLEEIVTLILNGAMEGKTVTVEDVRNSLSLNRQMSIVRAQVECNRVRDFFTHVSKLSNR